MCAAALTVVLCASLSAQTSGGDNLDFHTGTMQGWRGKGFYVTTADPRGPSLSLGLCSSDRGGLPQTGTRRYTFTVAPGTGSLRCFAYASRGPDCEPDDRLNILVVTASNEFVPMQVRTGSGWRSVSAVLPRQHAKGREYCWDLAPYVGQKVQIVLRDEDDRPGCHLFCSGFRLSRQDESETVDFAGFMRQLESHHQLLPMARYETKHFTAWSNAEASFTRDRLRNCEVMYAMFLKHFRARGFAVHAPATKLMVAVFDSQTGFEAYLAQKMPAAVTGVYSRDTNRLVLYDLQQNKLALDLRQKARENTRGTPMFRLNYLGTVEREINDWTEGGSLSTAMHETAHQLSFNCGLLNRYGDLPLWLGEGLACYCEATDRGRWQGLGEPNTGRMRTLVKVFQGKGQLLPLRTLVQNDKWRDDSNLVLAGYAQSWALFRMLMQERPEALRNYLQLIRARRTPDHRLADFAEAFGDPARLEVRYLAYLHEVLESNAARLRQ